MARIFVFFLITLFSISVFSEEIVLNPVSDADTLYKVESEFIELSNYARTGAVNREYTFTPKNESKGLAFYLSRLTLYYDTPISPDNTVFIECDGVLIDTLYYEKSNYYTNTMYTAKQSVTIRFVGDNVVNSASFFMFLK